MLHNISAWLDFLTTSSSTSLEPDLARVMQVADSLDLLSFHCPIVTVAGTNGKGSCVAYLETILLDAGYKVAAYTSPHFLHINERFRINGMEVSDEALCAAFAIVKAAYSKVKVPFTYFEFITIAALYLFKKANVDCMLLEVGLGGRLDPVNILDADIAALTTISLDHTDRLGKDRESIGYEKAGIMRRGQPVVCGDSQPPQSILDYARKIGGRIYRADGVQNGDCFSYGRQQSCWCWQYKKLRLNELPLPKLPLTSAAVALMVIYLLQKKLNVTAKSIYAGIERASLLGRLQFIGKNPAVILDVAHNMESASYLAKFLLLNPCRGRTVAVVGMLRDKDIMATFQQLIAIVNDWYIAELKSPRTATIKILEKCLQDLNQVSCYTCESILDAYHKAIAKCGKQDRVIVFGSFYAVAEILQEGHYGQKN